MTTIKTKNSMVGNRSPRIKPCDQKSAVRHQKRIENKLKSFRRLTSVVLGWMKAQGYNYPWGFPSDSQGIASSIWDPIIKRSKDLRGALSEHKLRRSWFLKILGSNRRDAGDLMRSPPKGTPPFWLKTLSEYRKVADHRSRPLRDLKVALTALYSTRLICLPPDPNLSDITGAPLHERVPSAEGGNLSGGHLKKFWRTLGYKKLKAVPKSLRWTQYHITYKNGPNGDALLTSGDDWAALDDQTKVDLGVVGGDLFRENVPKLDEEFAPAPLGGGGVSLKSRKLACFSDMEGKTRVIAILDYYSQTVLRPLHVWIYRILGRIPQDCTFNQGKFITLAEKWQEFYSCDLKSATDRFPIGIIRDVLCGILPDHYVAAWQRLMVRLPFSWRDTHVKYEVGNPMGAYSSWASFALAHHYVVAEACGTLGIDWRKARYALLGDDIVFGDRRLYLEYRKILDRYGVQVSLEKTQESLTLMEFAKRWVFKGEEITPLPLPAFKQAGTKFHYLVPLLDIERVRGLRLPGSLTDAYMSYLTIHSPGKRKAEFELMLRYKAICTESILDKWKGRSRPSEFWNKLLMCVGQTPILPDEGDGPEKVNVMETMFQEVYDQWFQSCVFEVVDNFMDRVEKEFSSIRKVFDDPSHGHSASFVRATRKHFLGLNPEETVYYSEPGFGVRGSLGWMEYLRTSAEWIPWIGVWKFYAVKILDKDFQNPNARKDLPDQPWVLRAVGLPILNFKGRKENLRSLVVGRMARKLYRSIRGDGGELGALEAIRNYVDEW